MFDLFDVGKEIILITSASQRFGDFNDRGSCKFRGQTARCPRMRVIQYSRGRCLNGEAAAYWMARRSLSSGARSRDPVAGHDD
ncbi:hypothetical protein [Bradyrhizobium sp. ORS 111]|uniref:hypothetical protein n=1 Tax=Bradyrhizobium sp. ORS 111 TaxID=1685958 RepID=UPI00388F8610